MIAKRGRALDWQREVEVFLTSLPSRVQDAAEPQGAGERTAYSASVVVAAQQLALRLSGAQGMVMAWLRYRLERGCQVGHPRLKGLGVGSLFESLGDWRHRARTGTFPSASSRAGSGLGGCGRAFFGGWWCFFR